MTSSGRCSIPPKAFRRFWKACSTARRPDRQPGSERLPAVHLAAKNDRRGGLLHPVDAADLVEQLVQLLGRIRTQPGHIVELAAHCAQLLYLAHGTQAPHHLLARARLHLDPHICLQPTTHNPLAQAHAIAGDDLVLLQPLQTRVDGSTSDAQLAGEGGDAFAGVYLQQGDQLAIDFIQRDGAGIRHGESLRLTR
uniref:NicC n=2 Tax=Pseudomonas TaxID=286 RepID=B1N1A1_PSEPU|nr:NicC [Pseudomonas putida S16]ACV32408.1 NicC [Pseudomonas sp. HF-1]